MEAAESKACLVALSILLARRPHAVLLRTTHWKCHPSDIVQRIAANTSRSTGGPVSAVVQTALEPLPRPCVQFVAASSGGEQEREENILQILRSCIHYSPSGWCDPSALRGYPCVRKPWQELGRLLPRSTLRIFLESHKEFEVVPKDSGYGFYFKARAAASPTPTLVTGLGLASGRDISGGEQAAGSQPGRGRTEKLSLAVAVAPAPALAAASCYYKHAGTKHRPKTEEPGSYSSASETGAGVAAVAQPSYDSASRNWQAMLSDDRDLAGRHRFPVTSNAAALSSDDVAIAAEPRDDFASALSSDDFASALGFEETGLNVQTGYSISKYAGQ